MIRATAITSVPLLMLLGACQSVPQSPIPTVQRVDLERFMGDWYVIANIPTFLEKGAHNAVETYELLPERRVATRFRFRNGAFDGPLKVYNPTGFVRDDDSNAVWGMQFIWPIRAEYRVIFLDEDYSRTIIGRTRRDYVWLMARTPVLDEAEYAEMVQAVADAGYDVSLLERVPQRWPETAAGP